MVTNCPSFLPPFVEGHDLARADHPVFVWDGDAAAFAWANQAGLDHWGALSLQSFRASGLDRAMPAMLRLAELSATALPAEGIRQTLIFWTPRGACRLSCLCRPIDLGDGGHGLILEADPVADWTGRDNGSLAGLPSHLANNSGIRDASARHGLANGAEDHGTTRPRIPGQRVSGFLNGAIVAEQATHLPAPSDDDHHAMQEIARMLGHPGQNSAATGTTRDPQVLASTQATAVMSDNSSHTLGPVRQTPGVDSGARLRADSNVSGLAVPNGVTPNTNSDFISANATPPENQEISSEAFDNLNHELRTPLNSIIGFAEMMHTEQLGPIGVARYKEYAGDILDSAHHALSLINDLLDDSRVRAGHLNITLENLDVVELLQRVIALMQPQAMEASVGVVAGFPDELPPIHADSRAMRQILLNILTNAIKFTPPGGRVFVTAQHNMDGVTTIAVRDTGIGMTEQQIDEAMIPWTRLNGTDEIQGRSADTTTPGFGLGLPLVKVLTEAQHGTLQITSNPGEGTRVEVSLPVSTVSDRP